MPDEWEEVRGLDRNKPDANGRGLDADYDNVEVYVNGLVEAAPAR